MLRLSTIVGFCTLTHFAFADSNPSVQYYKALDCAPILDPGEVEPSRYDCGHLDKIEKGKCFAYGRFFENGEVIPQDVIKGRCTVNCRCYVSPETKMGSFRCAHVDCPFYRKRFYEENCFSQYSHDSCCAVKHHCAEEDGEIETCEYDGNTYREGERFYPSDKPCHSCICMKGYNGTIGEPWCKQISCDLYIHYSRQIQDGCVPTYYKSDDCCPIPTWRCPDEDADEVIGEPIAAAKSEDHMCKFGKAKLGVGQSIQKDPDNPCIDCTCQTPPHITCVMNTTCYESS